MYTILGQEYGLSLANKQKGRLLNDCLYENVIVNDAFKDQFSDFWITLLMFSLMQLIIWKDTHTPSLSQSAQLQLRSETNHTNKTFLTKKLTLLKTLLVWSRQANCLRTCNIINGEIELQNDHQNPNGIKLDTGENMFITGMISRIMLQ